jgi:glutathione S-transferase
MPIDIWTNIQKEPWFIAMNPNGRIPTLTDRSRGGFHVFETAAILVYLAQHYDKEKRFSFDVEKEANDYSEMLQWVFFAVRCAVLCELDIGSDNGFGRTSMAASGRCKARVCLSIHRDARNASE